jgi:nitrite reductase/ring-hydroxylating ferredoxin subunit
MTPVDSNGKFPTLLDRRTFARSFVLATVFGGFVCARAGRLFLAEAIAVTDPSVGLLRLDLTDARFEELQNPEFGSIKIRVTGMATSFPRIVITRVSPTQFFAVTSKCTHEGFTDVQPYNPAIGTLLCTKHGSEYNPDGTVVVEKEPGQAPLPSYVTRFHAEANILEIEIPDLGYSITGAFVSAVHGNRFALSFPTVRQRRYAAWFREDSAAGPWTPVSFSLAPDGPADQSELTGDGLQATVFVDVSAAAGFFTISRE